VTVLFTDVVGSTETTQRKVDAKAQEIVRAHEKIARRAVDSFGGKEFDFGDAGRAKLKGFRDPVDLYAVQWLSGDTKQTYCALSRRASTLTTLLAFAHYYGHLHLFQASHNALSILRAR
jgi:hypothetical protein